MALQWTSDFSVGETTIDRQHMELFQRFNDLLDACRQGRGKERISLLLDFLDQYVVFHFRTEEDLMQRHGFPEAAAHRAQHAHFIDQLHGLRSELQQEGPSTAVLVSTNETVLRWLIDHIRKTDTHLGAFLRGRA